jgi:hypothetical protein
VPGGAERLRDEDQEDDGADRPRGLGVADAHRRMEEALHRSSIGAATDTAAPAQCMAGAGSAAGATCGTPRAKSSAATSAPTAKMPADQANAVV